MEVVDFFCRHHSRAHISEGIATGNTGVLTDGDEIIGTGCFDANHITGVYVLPAYQGQGCGSHIMDCLEAEIAKKYDMPRFPPPASTSTEAIKPSDTGFMSWSMA